MYSTVHINKVERNFLRHFIRSFCFCASLNTSQRVKTKSTKKVTSSKRKLPEARVQLGRLGTSLKVGILGAPNIGKSTFFNVLTNSQIAAENFPFCTIDPNESRVPVPDKRFDFLCEHYKPAKNVPSFLKVVDVAGLVEGASEGAGLGNAFLSHISACDAIFHVLRAFDDEDVIHMDESIDPVRDLGTILNELRIKDVEYFESRLDAAKKKYMRSGDKESEEEFKIFTKILKVLKEDEKHLRFVKDWNVREIELLNRHLPLTAKPMVYIVNLSEKDFISKNNDWLKTIKQWIDENDPGAQLFPFSGAFEAKAVEMERNEFEKYCNDVKVESVLPEITRCGYSLLQLQSFFTVGSNEVKAWTIEKGTTAPKAGGRIHSDIEKGFIIAEVMKFEELKKHGSVETLKAVGKYYQKGRHYIVCDGDIILFKFNISKGGKR